jgi:hypothetical protein
MFVYVSASCRGPDGKLFYEIPLYDLPGFQWHFNVFEFEK